MKKGCKTQIKMTRICTKGYKIYEYQEMEKESQKERETETDAKINLTKTVKIIPIPYIINNSILENFPKQKVFKTVINHTC